MTDTLQYVLNEEIERIRHALKDPVARVSTLADVFRLNTLSMIMEAGSGHIGSSFSAMDIVSWLWLEELKNPNDTRQAESDIYFSSKGHDAPGLYAVMSGVGRLDESLLHHLRRIGGLPGHPDVGTPFIPTNTGPLGMGLSKARGLAGAKRAEGTKGRVYVLLGDGELQEGQNWESLQPIANDGYEEITAIVDHNKIQSDTFVEDVSDLGDLEAKFRAFGWEVFQVNGHDLAAIRVVLDAAKRVQGRPQVIIADTIKGKGVSFMEKLADDGYYKFHSGAPSKEAYQKAAREIIDRINASLSARGVEPLQTDAMVPIPERKQAEDAERLVTAYGDELVKIARERKDIVAMDADLVLDTGLIPFSKEFPDRYVEAGIAEQYMVSMAGGYALKGMLPIVHSFECFLSTHANAQIYNNASEKTKIIYVGSLAGVIPAAPGHSHQSLRGISLFGSIPGMTIIEPANESEARMAIRWAVEENPESTYIRLVSVPVAIPYNFPENYALKKGAGVPLLAGGSVAIVSYGPILLREAVLASIALRREGVEVAVFNMPWLNAIDAAWVRNELGSYTTILTLDDHYLQHGIGEQLSAAANRTGIKARVVSLGLADFPECGTTTEVLAHHGLDAAHITSEIRKNR